MHPMFVKLFLQASEDDPLAEEQDRRRAANRTRRTRSRVATRVAVRGQVPREVIGHLARVVLAPGNGRGPAPPP
jgi:hypothetical protein